ncbi:TonB-dependent receptor [Uliginosibacterium paludis]|uniref:TonB-dependent siderophore receptor n=1 Tax=Uliginosibacterium paludis TaxID=1615952 RepID=A0ABV2CRY5_9RHOO
MSARHLRVSRLAQATHLALISLALSQPALAQTTQTPANKDAKTLGEVRVTADRPVETEAKESYQAVTSTIGKGKQALRDIPQSVTVVTEKLIDDRNLDTLKDVLHQTAGVTFLAAEGGEEDIRLRGFSMQQTGDILVDGMRDPAIYERDTFNYDRLEVLRGSASMLFGRGSTGGVVNQVSKQAFLLDQHELNLTYGSHNYARVETDLNFTTGQSSAFRLTAMKNQADNNGAGASIDKEGAAGNFRWGIGERDEFSASLFYLKNRNGINYGLPWLTRGGGNSGSNTLIDKDPKTYYGLDSDQANSDVVSSTFSHLHRFMDGGELKTAVRAAKVARDQRASTVRFVTATTEDTINDNTALSRGTQIKIQDLDNQVVQSDYTNKFNWFGLRHDVTTGVDFNNETRRVFAAVSPATLTKSNTTVGDTDGTAAINEDLRSIRKSNEFDATSAGAYFQDLAQIAEHWKLLGGLRFDYFNGNYRTFSTADTSLGAQTSQRGRSDKLWSKRFGVLYQPTNMASFHFSYGTSFNTSGDTYQYDLQTANTDPEKSRNIELGSKLDLASGNATLRLALFHSTKYNERNTDTETVAQDPTTYMLSAERYAKGFETDITGRITPNWESYFSYTWIPVAKIAKGARQSNATEPEGQRPGLIPKHQATWWNTYKIGQSWRVGLGLNGRTKMSPQLVTAYKVDGYVTADAMAEYEVTRDLTFKFNITNLTNKLYADSLYRGHYVPGKGRVLQLTGSYRF